MGVCRIIREDYDYRIEYGEILYCRYNIKHNPRNYEGMEKYLEYKEIVNEMTKKNKEKYDKVLDHLWKKFPKLTPKETTYLCYQYKDHNAIQRHIDKIKRFI